MCFDPSDDGHEVQLTCKVFFMIEYSRHRYMCVEYDSSMNGYWKAYEAETESKLNEPEAKGNI